MKNLVLNHDAETSTGMFNLKPEDAQRIRNLITFETLKGYMLSDELYEDDDKAPRILTTKSGCIERCLDHLETDSEKALFFLIFVAAHDGIGKCYMIYRHLDKHISKLKESSSFLNIEDGLEGQLKELIVKKITQDITEKFSALDSIFDCIKKNNYNFDLFMDEYTSKYGDLTDNISETLTSAKKTMHDDEDIDED